MMYLLKKIFIIFAKINLYFFEKSTKKVSLTQQDLLKSILKSYSITDFGKDHNISAKMVYDEFSQTVPIQNYESLEKYIIKQKSGLKRSLTEKKVKVWEKTSGSSGKSKFIPYTSEIFKVFGKVIFLWVSDLLVNGPKFKTGKVFFSLSPQFSSEELSVDNHSLSDDSEYLPFWMRLFFSKYFVMPKGLKNLQDPKSFKLVLMSHLIATRDLETIFIWSPSYLISLLEFADENKIEIISIISQRKYKYKNYTYNFPDADIEFIKAKWGRWEEL